MSLPWVHGAGMKSKQLLELPADVMQRLKVIGKSSAKKGFHKIYEILLTPSTGDTTPMRIDAEQTERHEATRRALAGARGD